MISAGHEGPPGQAAQPARRRRWPRTGRDVGRSGGGPAVTVTRPCGARRRAANRSASRGEHPERLAGGRLPGEPGGVAQRARGSARSRSAGSVSTRVSAGRERRGRRHEQPADSRLGGVAVAGDVGDDGGVPQAAASVSVMPQPSRADAEVSTQARW